MVLKINEPVLYLNSSYVLNAEIGSRRSELAIFRLKYLGVDYIIR